MQGARLSAMNEFQTFADVIAAWPDDAKLAEDVGVSLGLVRVWKIRGIPGKHWPDLAKAAKRRRIDGVTIGALGEIYAIRRQAQA